MKFFIAQILAIFWSCLPVANADVGGAFTLVNIIKPEDYERIKSAYKSFVELNGENHAPFLVTLNTEGGDVETAMKIGRFLRETNSVVSVEKCYSACPLIIAGSIFRYYKGGEPNVGIHRLYDPQDSVVTISGQIEKQAWIGASVKKYLAEMDVSTDLYDEMQGIPPSSIKKLTVDDLKRYRLFYQDAATEAAGIAGFAKKLGVSAKEVIRRKAKAGAECISEDFVASQSCYSRILYTGH